jgi:hypothetical protein
VQNKNTTRFYYKEKTKIKQSYDKKTYPKLIEQIESNREFYLYLYLLGI